MRAEGIDLEQVPKRLELLLERCAAPGIVQAQPLELRADLVPRLDQHPGGLYLDGFERQVAFQPVNEEEPTLVLDCDERETGVDVHR